MGQEFTDEEIRQWIAENKDEIATVIEQTGTFLGRSAADMDSYWQKLRADATHNAENWKSWRENYTTIMQGYHDRAKGYTNLISIAGYAGFFWLWDKVSSIMTPFYFTVTGLCLTVSLAFFVFSEVLLMALTGLGELGESKTPDKPRSLNEEIKIFGDERKRFYRINELVWKWHFYPAAGIGLFGVVIVFVFWICGIIDGGYPPPSSK